MGKYVQRKRQSRFGQVIGVAPGGVPCYSSHYDSVDPREYPTGKSYIGREGDVYTGHRYQCVEFARRWLVVTQQLTFPDVHMAYQILQLTYGIDVKTDETYPMQARERNGSVVRPVFGSLLLWKPSGFFNFTGHVAVVTEVTDTYVRVAEQNVTDAAWDDGCDYAREVKASVDPKTGGFFIEEDIEDNTHVLGWVTLLRS